MPPPFTLPESCHPSRSRKISTPSCTFSDAPRPQRYPLTPLHSLIALFAATLSHPQVILAGLCILSRQGDCSLRESWECSSVFLPGPYSSKQVLSVCSSEWSLKFHRPTSPNPSVLLWVSSKNCPAWYALFLPSRILCSQLPAWPPSSLPQGSAQCHLIREDSPDHSPRPCSPTITHSTSSFFIANRRTYYLLIGLSVTPD